MISMIGIAITTSALLIVLSVFNREITANGYLTQLGLFHDNMFNQSNLSCDLMEPFRCLIDATTRKGYNLNQFKESDFNILKGEYKLKIEKNIEYCTAFYEVLVDRKMDIFKYVQAYYRCFMQNKGIENYPQFIV